MGEHKDWRVIRRVVTPPAFPLIRPLRPIAAHRAKHIPPEDISADILKTPCRNVVIYAGLAVFLAMHCQVLVGKYQSNSFSPRTPIGFRKILYRPQTVTL